jgi:hypothetical protein
MQGTETVTTITCERSLEEYKSIPSLLLVCHRHFTSCVATHSHLCFETNPAA